MDNNINENVNLSNDTKTIKFTKVNGIVNKDEDIWIRPWNIEKFDDLYNRDDRFFSVLIKGMLSWLNSHIVMYNKSINHFIYNTGSTYFYIESNGYEFSWNETTGEDMIYMHLPRCIVEIDNFQVDTQELSQPYSRGIYERRSNNLINSYYAEIARIPINMNINLKYVLNNFNESIILLQELIEKILFQKYFKITYLGQIIQCSIELPDNFNIEINKIDMESNETNQKNINLSIIVKTNYPVINERSEIRADKIINTFRSNIDIYQNGLLDENGDIDKEKNTDTENYLLND